MEPYKFIYPFTLLPNYRGKVRILTLTHKIFDSHYGHNSYRINLNKPVRYSMKIHEHCAHELMSFYMGGYEEGTTLFLDKVYDGSGCFYDIGANVGYISIPFTIMQKRKNMNREKNITISFEAIKSNHEALIENISTNNLTQNVRTFCVGLGEREKIVDIQVEGNLGNGCGTGTANILEDTSDYQCERIKLKITTLNRMIDDGQVSSNCSLMKIDTDGYDFFIIQGATTLLNKSRPVIYGEFSKHCLSWHDQTIDDVISFMRTYEYQTYAKVNEGWTFTKRVDTDRFISDLLLVPNEKVDAYQWCLSDF